MTKRSYHSASRYCTLFLGSGKGHHRERDWDGDVDPDLARLDLCRELPGGGAVVGEDSCTVAILVLVDQLDCLVQRVDAQHAKNRSEYLRLGDPT